MIISKLGCVRISTSPYCAVGLNLHHGEIMLNQNEGEEGVNNYTAIDIIRKERMEKIKVDTNLRNFSFIRQDFGLIRDFYLACGYFGNDRERDSRKPRACHLSQIHGSEIESSKSECSRDQELIFSHIITKYSSQNI